MERKISTCIFALILILVGICDSTLGWEKIAVCGTGDSQELLRILAAAFEKNNPQTTVAIPDSIGSSGGIRNTAAGTCDLGRIARPAKDKEKKYNLNSMFFAKSPIVFGANHSMKGVDNITAEQVVNIYSGSITSWKDLGGRDTKIYVANREEGDSSRSVLAKKIPDFKTITNPVGKILYTYDT